MKINFIPLHWHKLPALPKTVWAIMASYGILLLFLAFRHLFASHKPKKYVAKLGNLTWRRNQFCRGWLITGDTGSGKTSSGINQLAHRAFSDSLIVKLPFESLGI